ncbi:MAG: hypothetical protein II160_06475, partial [Selenomonas sp.]|nr:hypothetical protein [Selenomonas sp.]
CLDSKRAVICCAEMGRGVVNSVDTSVRRIVEKALKVKASSPGLIQLSFQLAIAFIRLLQQPLQMLDMAAHTADNGIRRALEFRLELIRRLPERLTVDLLLLAV